LIAELAKRKVFRTVSSYAVICFVILQIADVSFEPLGIPDRVIQLLIGAMFFALPLVAYVAWVFDISPDSRFYRGKGRRAWVEATMAGAGLLLLCAGAWFAFQDTTDELNEASDVSKVAAQPQTAATESVSPSIEVRTISILGADPALTDYAAIVTQDIKDALANDPAMVLINTDAGAADYIVTGKVRRTRDGVRTSLELQRVHDGRIIWSEALDDKRDAGQAIEFQYGHHVAYVIQSMLKNIGYREFLERRGATENPLALNAFFLGLAENDAARVGDGNYTVAMDHQRRAITLDPSFTEPYAWLLLTYAIRAQGTISAEEALPKARELAQQIKPLKQTPAVSFALAYKNLRLDLDYSTALKHILVAEAGSFYPANRMQMVKCQIALAQGDLNEAISQCSGAAANGGSLEFYVLGNLLYVAGRYDDAVKAFETSLARSESGRTNNRETGIHDNSGFHLLDMMARAQYLAGNADAASAILDTPLAREFNRFPEKYAASLALLGRKEEAREAVAKMVEKDQRGTADTVAAAKGFWAYLYLEDFDKAFTWLGRAIENRETFIIGAMRVSPQLDVLRQDPRFQTAMGRVEEIENQGSQAGVSAN
jgi:tetratricopeptide (TPR) repeat protein